MPDGYTHDPDAFDDVGERTVDPEAEEADVPADAPPEAEAGERTHPAAVHREFDWRGWTVVVGIVVAFLVIPSIIYLYPHVGPMFGLTFWDTYLALPMVPAVVLALLAVWATTRP